MKRASRESIAALVSALDRDDGGTISVSGLLYLLVIYGVVDLLHCFFADAKSLVIKLEKREQENRGKTDVKEKLESEIPDDHIQANNSQGKQHRSSAVEKYPCPGAGHGGPPP